MVYPIIFPLTRLGRGSLRESRTEQHLDLISGPTTLPALTVKLHGCIEVVPAAYVLVLYCTVGLVHTGQVYL